MYLSDKELKKILNLLDISFDEVNETFDIEKQIQPCSIDLRLDNVFWKYRKAGTIDLMKSKIFENATSRYWQKIVVTPGKSITIQPGELILGRSLEVFTVPSKYVGKIEGRSSFSRLGLSIHLSSDFINPGWRGHKSLQILNNNKNSIRLIPKLPICQLMLSELNEIPEKVYGNESLQSKYMLGDGGPSYWWRDERIKELQKTLISNNISLELQYKLIEKIGNQEVEVLDRFDEFISNTKLANVSNIEYLLNSFLKQEEKSDKIQKIFINGTRILCGAILSITVKFGYDYLINNIFDLKKEFIIFSVISIIFIILTIYSFIYIPKTYLTKNQLDKIDEIKF